MGNTATTYHFRLPPDPDAPRLLARLRSTGLRAYVSDLTGPWATVVEESSESQADEAMRTVLLRLSQALGRRCLLLYVHDSDICGAQVASEGRLTFEYQSEYGIP